MENKYCFQCKEEITYENNGLVINEDTPHEIYQCNDCHYNEFGINIWPFLLVIKNKDEI